MSVGEGGGAGGASGNSQKMGASRCSEWMFGEELIHFSVRNADDCEGKDGERWRACAVGASETSVFDLLAAPSVCMLGVHARRRFRAMGSVRSPSAQVKKTPRV